ncbi:hypothetical protein BQ8794_80164 [Mesorhizobium prunaredense]|uniref:Uncharacterized protein n=1 Tax=Mesorhizobium prunaredense TaxID=1631249 RepID=A0A1R3VIT0_9HYPH|nr:hypothetical protein BQ8794_80164 [Mesorhizobium prunaredense]
MLVFLDALRVGFPIRVNANLFARLHIACEAPQSLSRLRSRPAWGQKLEMSSAYKAPFK